MHKYLRAAGFKDLTEAGTYNLLWNKAISPENLSRIYDLGDNQSLYEYRLKVNGGIGVCAAVLDCGELEILYYYPYFESSEPSSMNTCTLERHTAADTYAGVLDEYTLGISLIFFVINPLDYRNYLKLHGDGEFKGAALSAFSNEGIVILPVAADPPGMYEEEEEINRQMLMEAAFEGDEEALETLTASDIDMLHKINDRMYYEDLYSVVEQTFMPCGIECDQYSIIGEILDVSGSSNLLTGEQLWLLRVSCNDIVFRLCIRKEDLMGEPMKGRRLKCKLWMQGKVDITV